MKFGARLEGSMRPQWATFYLDYKALKKTTVCSSKPAPKEDSQEEQFVEEPNLEHCSMEEGADTQGDDFFDMFFTSELDKVDHFFSSQLSEFALHIQAIDEDICTLKAASPRKKPSAGPPEHEEYVPPDQKPVVSPSIPHTSSRSRLPRPRSVASMHPHRASHTSYTSNSMLGSSDDENFENFGLPEIGPVTKETVRQEFIELYRELGQLKNFGVLNYTGFTKILKKFTKNRKKARSQAGFQRAEAMKKRLQAALAAREFAKDAGELSDLTERVERNFAGMFTHDDIVEARGELLVKQQRQVDWSLFMMGIRIGMTVVLAFWLLWDSVVDPRIVLNNCQLVDEDRSLVDAAAFPVFRLCACVNLVVWCWGLSLYVWKSARINALYVFELAPNRTASYSEVLDLASHLSFGYFALFLIYNKVRVGEFSDTIHKDIYSLMVLAYFVVLLGRALKPQPCFCRNVGKVLMAPWVPVSFFHSFVADWMTSLVKPFQDLLHTILFIVTGRVVGHCNPNYWNNCHSDDGSEGTKSSWVVLTIALPLISGFPLLIRMFQCLRKYKDTGARMPNLANAFKYAFATVVVFFGTFSPDLYDLEDASAVHILFIIVVALSTLYTYSWDVLQDWSLGDSQHGCLRETLMYKHHCYYWAAIFVDVFLRFLWVITLVPHNSKAPFGADFYNTVSPFLGVIEILRRTMWGFIRVENEHLNNFSGYRKVKLVPLDLEDSQLEDEATQKTNSMIGLLEIVFFVVTVLAFGVVAFFTKS